MSELYRVFNLFTSNKRYTQITLPGAAGKIVQKVSSPTNEMGTGDGLNTVGLEKNLLESERSDPRGNEGGAYRGMGDNCSTCA